MISSSAMQTRRGVASSPSGWCASTCRTHMREFASLPRPSVQAHASRATEVQGPAIPVDVKAVKRMRLKALEDCELAVSIYPMFAYNALNGGGWADVQAMPGQPGLLKVTFDPEGVNIPDLTWKTASIFKVPIPPPLCIAIQTQQLWGTVNTSTGEVSLFFDAKFNFTAGPLYSAPPLIVRTTLGTGYTKGEKGREATGTPFINGKGRLVGTATVEKTGDAFLDTFLLLPNDALAIMSAELEFE